VKSQKGFVAKRTSPSLALGRLPKTELVRIYVWEKPVRISHWLIVVTLVFLSVTGFYLHRPFVLSEGHGAFLMAKMRFVHVVSGFVLIAALALRLYWFFKGNFWAHWTAYVPIHRQQWEGMGDMLKFYLFMRFDPGRRAGHNPLAALSYCVIYSLLVVEILTGLALYSQVLGNSVLHAFIGWLPLYINISYLRLTHYFLMFVFFAFTLFHVYASILVSLEEENGLVDSIFSGWKFMPAGALRKEISEIPEARGFAKRHSLLPEGTPEEMRTGATPKRRPGPGPVALYRNWISFIGTGVIAVGVIVFIVLTAYHTIGGGSLVQPYGDLVIFFFPPMVIFSGIALILVGMWFQWIRWRKNKPLSFARYPKWDLNLAAERRALLAVGIGAAIISVPAIYGSGQAYLYTDAVPFCGSVCHSMTPEFVTAQSSPHAHVGCAQCHVGPGATGYLAAKLHGMTELYETINGEFPRPIPTPITALKTIQDNCETCHWPSNFWGTREIRRTHFLSDEQNTRWEIDLAVPIGGGSPAYATKSGIHWHVAAKVEYVASDAASQTIPWVRAVDPKTGIAEVYTSSPQAAPPTAEIHSMNCMDCHNRPTHILESPDQSVEAALASGRIDSSLPFIKQQSLAVLSATYTDRETALRAIDSKLRGYYQKNYAGIYSGKQQSLDAAIAFLQDNYDHNYFPAMHVRWDTYSMNDGHLNSSGCFRCHDGQHKSVDGTVIRSDCDACHKILRQGPANAVQFAQGGASLPFKHPIDVGGLETSQPCSSCHTGGAQ
jgi:Ni/Fe-hydrogenase b-type cytochrome subunit